MALLDLFSKRQRTLRGEVPDVYRFDEIPQPLRVQIVHIIRDALGSDEWAGDSRSERAYASLHQMLAREFGVFQLANRGDAKENLFQFILQETDVEKVLDAIEVSFRIIAGLGSDGTYTYYTKPSQGPEEAIAELNARFREHGIGYQFEAGSIVKADSEYLHSEVIKPALSLLADKRYAGAQKEFLTAHQHYRKGENEQAISEALKAFESTMKSICAKRKWIHKDTDTAKQLLDVCVREGLIPPALQSEFTALRSVLESGVPTIRNRQGGHGAGVAPRNVPSYLAAYALQLAAASIVFLVAAEADLA